MCPRPEKSNLLGLNIPVKAILGSSPLGGQRPPVCFLTKSAGGQNYFQ